MKRLIIICATCGVGKSTVINYLRDHSSLKNYIFLDSDEVGLNWHEYKDLPNGSKMYSQDSLKRGVEISGDKNIVWATCMNPQTYAELNPIHEITETYLVNLICSNKQLYSRLKGRAAERMTDNDEFIEEQIKYMNWFKNNANLMDLVIDTSMQTIEVTANEVEEYIERFE